MPSSPPSKTSAELAEPATRAPGEQNVGGSDAARRREQWRALVRDRYPEADFRRSNRSGIELQPVYDETDVDDGQRRRQALPGQFPYTRGIYPIHYQYQPWMDLQIIGYGVASQLRERMDLLRREGGARGYFGGDAYNVIFDMPTSMGFDPDYPGVLGSVGDSGVSICKASDYETLLEGVDLTKTHFSMVCNAGSPAMLALYLAAARRMGHPTTKLRGNITNYIWDFFGHCGGMNFSPKGSYRLCVDVCAYCAEFAPNFGTVTFSEHNIAEAGATSVQSVALALAAVVALNRECEQLGLSVDEVAVGYGFHLRFGDDFFEDIAKARALRTLYAKINAERFACETPNALKARIHAQTAGSLLTVQQPQNNIMRNGFGALAAVLSGVNGMTINAFDEALGLPTEEAVTLSLRTSQILAEEAAVTEVSDPLGGSYYVEALTTKIMADVEALLDQIDEQGGLIECIESGWARGIVAESAFEWRRQVEAGERTVVGVNKFTTDEEAEVRVFEPDPRVGEMALQDLADLRARRDQAGVDRSLDEIRRAGEAVMEGREIGAVTAALVAAAEADTTLGEMQAVLFDVFGRNK